MKNKKKILVGFGMALAVLALCAGLRSSSLLDGLERKLSNGLYRERALADEIVIVGIDEWSLGRPEDGGLGSFSSWPRSFFAQSIGNLREAGAHSQYLDVIFKNETQYLSYYEVAKEAAGAATYAELGETLVDYLKGENPQDLELREALGEDVFLLKYSGTTPELEDGQLKVSSAVESIDLLSEVAESGFADLAATEQSEVVYKMPVGYVVGGIFEEHLVLKLARDYLYRGSEVGSWSFDHSRYSFDEQREIPLEDGQYFVNYAGKSYSFEMLSFVDVFKGNFDPAEVRGKIVMIGVTAPILQDRHATPIDGDVPMPGVEIQANALQTVLDGAFLKPMSFGGFVSLMVLMLGLSAAAFLFLPALGASAVLALEVVAYPLLARFAFGRGLIMDLIWPLMGVVALYAAVLAYRNFTEFREKRQIRSAFSHYVSPALVNQISENPELLALGGERREISVLFLDLENFTSLSESMDPADVVRVINTYFDALANVIVEAGGTVDKFEGDAIMALFGAPVASAEHAVQACKAALALRAKVVELNGKTGQNLNVRIGVASGEAIVGNMGSSTRFDYTAMGDTVNTASRLESANKHYGSRVLVNTSVMKAAQQHCVFRRMDRVRLKGKQEPLDIYEVLGPLSELTEAGRGALEQWHQALEYYRNQNWAEAEKRLASMNDGAARVYLQRIAFYKQNPPQGWDGTFTFETK